ncbi:hypothetical protein HN51_055297 [Arachis hypogaea]
MVRLGSPAMPHMDVKAESKWEHGCHYSEADKDFKSLTNASAYCKAESGWHKKDEILDDSWVQQSRKKGPSTSHLD